MLQCCQRRAATLTIFVGWREKVEDWGEYGAQEGGAWRAVGHLRLDRQLPIGLDWLPITTHCISVGRVFPACSGVSFATHGAGGWSRGDQVAVCVAVHPAAFGRGTLVHLDSISSDESFDGGEEASLVLLHPGYGSGRGDSALDLGVLSLGLGAACWWGRARLLRRFAHSQPHRPSRHIKEFQRLHAQNGVNL